jgi:hypothetical protein
MGPSLEETDIDTVKAKQADQLQNVIMFEQGKGEVGAGQWVLHKEKIVTLKPAATLWNRARSKLRR